MRLQKEDKIGDLGAAKCSRSRGIGIENLCTDVVHFFFLYLSSGSEILARSKTFRELSLILSRYLD